MKLSSTEEKKIYVWPIITCVKSNEGRDWVIDRPTETHLLKRKERSQGSHLGVKDILFCVLGQKIQ